MPRYFTVKQAEDLLPEVDAAIRAAVASKAEYQKAEAESQQFSRRIMLQGGVLVDHNQLLEQKNRRESAAHRLKESVEKIHEFGCLVKDLDMGLVDFPTLFKGEEVYLCWKIGEPGIRFWHGVEDGFRGRKPIDDEFVQHHQGDLPN
jgi:hypothetical protein